mmetsp:Transcript_1707/g.6660  ORF Transcript_1707/g.6660 Transcript_1707/m.6660 type:complete len:292 (-) Transcript_1707:198-1073(-)
MSSEKTCSNSRWIAAAEVRPLSDPDADSAEKTNSATTIAAHLRSPRLLSSVRSPANPRFMSRTSNSSAFWSLRVLIWNDEASIALWATPLRWMASTAANTPFTAFLTNLCLGPSPTSLTLCTGGQNDGFFTSCCFPGYSASRDTPPGPHAWTVHRLVPTPLTESDVKYAMRGTTGMEAGSKGVPTAWPSHVCPIVESFGLEYSFVYASTSVSAIDAAGSLQYSFSSTSGTRGPRSPPSGPSHPTTLPAYSFISATPPASGAAPTTEKESGTVPSSPPRHLSVASPACCSTA